MYIPVRVMLFNERTISCWPVYRQVVGDDDDSVEGQPQDDPVPDHLKAK